MHYRFSWFGVGLVVVGIALLLNRFGNFPFGWHLVFWAVIAIAGAFKVYNGFLMKRRGSAFWGTLFVVAGTMNVLDDLGLVSLDHPFVPAVVFLSIGAGFLTMYLVAPGEWHVLVPSVIFLGIGGLILLSDLGYMYRWDVEDFVRTYWPAALIIFGASLLLNRQATQ